MGLFDQLAEARIQDWIRRGRPHAEQAEPFVDGGALEAQLFGEIIALGQAARAEPDDRARMRLLEEARKRQLQLSVLLESTGRPLAAQALAERLQKLYGGDSNTR